MLLSIAMNECFLTTPSFLSTAPGEPKGVQPGGVEGSAARAKTSFNQNTQRRSFGWSGKVRNARESHPSELDRLLLLCLNLAPIAYIHTSRMSIQPSLDS